MIPSDKSLRHLAVTLIQLGQILLTTLDRDVSEDVLYLARAIQGEGAALFGDQRNLVGQWIGHTALNRAAKPWWPDSIKETVEQAFHGYANIEDPDEWAIALAKVVLQDHDRDITNGALFVLSSDDLDRMGARHRADEAIRVFRSPRGHELHFFRHWVGE